MAYRLRIESNAFEADSQIQKMLNTLNRLKKSAGKILGVKSEDFGGNNIKELYGINQRTFQRSMDWADQDFDRQINENKWRWKGPDGQTRRKNGQTVTEPRDIVDTGELLNSKQRIPVSNSVVEFEWTAEHAEGVHDGYSLKGEGSNPARPWTEETLKDLPGIINNISNN